MDLFDRAQETDNRFRKQAIAHAQKVGSSSGVSRTRCLDCDCLIPEGRRKAVPGCERCVTCEGKFETLRRR